MQTIQSNTIDKSGLVQEALKSAMTYEDYKLLVAQHVADGTNSGNEITESLIDYTLLNNRRMKRWSKTLRIDPAVLEMVAARNTPIEWLVITESWCGDAAHATPIMEKFAMENPNISLKVVLRDQHPKLMDAFLTNNARSIPKLIAFDNDNNTVIGEWGPRPTKATQLVNEYKAKHGALTPEFKQDLQMWYNKDKGQDIAKDLLELL